MTGTLNGAPALKKLEEASKQALSTFSTRHRSEIRAPEAALSSPHSRMVRTHQDARRDCSGSQLQKLAPTVLVILRCLFLELAPSTRYTQE